MLTDDLSYCSSLDSTRAASAEKVAKWEEPLREDDELVHIEDTLASESLAFLIEHIVEGCMCEGKWCPSCELTLCAGCFYRSKSNKGGLAYRCRECTKTYAKIYNARYKSTHEEQIKAHRRNNAEKIRLYKRNYREKNKEQIKAQKAEDRAIRKGERMETNQRQIDVLVGALRSPETRGKILQRFLAHVEVQEDECWHWKGGISRGRGGYGRFTVMGEYMWAHRVAYELLIGPIPNNMQIDHLCRVRHCVNPDHLEVVTLQENVSRSTHYIRGTNSLARRAVPILFGACNEVLRLVENCPSELSNEIKTILAGAISQSANIMGKTLPYILQQDQENNEEVQ